MWSPRWQVSQPKVNGRDKSSLRLSCHRCQNSMLISSAVHARVCPAPSCTPPHRRRTPALPPLRRLSRLAPGIVLACIRAPIPAIRAAVLDMDTAFLTGPPSLPPFSPIRAAPTVAMVGTGPRLVAPNHVKHGGPLFFLVALRSFPRERSTRI